MLLKQTSHPEYTWVQILVPLLILLQGGRELTVRSWLHYDHLPHGAENETTNICHMATGTWFIKKYQMNFGSFCTDDTVYIARHNFKRNKNCQEKTKIYLKDSKIIPKKISVTTYRKDSSTYFTFE